jgi:hypothetical protein
MGADDDALRAKLTALAVQIVDRALSDNVPLADKIEALKIAGSFDTGRRKLKDQGDPPADADSFGAFASRIEHATNGESKL